METSPKGAPPHRRSKSFSSFSPNLLLTEFETGKIIKLFIQAAAEQVFIRRIMLF